MDRAKSWDGTICDGEVSLLGGAAQTEREVAQFEWAIEKYQPKIAAIVAPLGLELGGNRRDHVYIVDGAQHGDVLAGVWEIGVGNLAPIHCFVEEPTNRPLRTIRDRYRQCGINSCGDGGGIVDTQELPYCNGLEVWIGSDTWARTWILDIHIPPLSLNDIRVRGFTMPLRWGNDDQTRTLAKGEVCSLMWTAP